ncbi:MAG: hypothetical protein FK734_00095 [Asgard group archaeon]|nr:hypothetical protein [Asgard group archaeon]
MSKSSTDLGKLDKRYIEALLNALESRNEKKAIDPELYEKLKENYTKSYEFASDKSKLTEGFTTLTALQPNLDTLIDSVGKFLERVLSIEGEKKIYEDRIVKLENLLKDGKIAEPVFESKKKEYEVQLMAIDDRLMEYVSGIPDSLIIIEEINEMISEKLDELEVKGELEGISKSDIASERKELQAARKDIQKAAKDLSALANVDFKKERWAAKVSEKKEPEVIEQAIIQPLRSDVTSQVSPRIEQASITEQPAAPRRDISAFWKNIKIGKFLGEITLIGGTYAIISTDRPSLSIIRDYALTGPKVLRSSTNPKVIEDKLKKEVMSQFNVTEEKALLPEQLINYALHHKIGVDLFKLINSYYASVGRGAVNIQNDRATINENAEVITLAENVGLLGRRVLAPDGSLIGVVHELYYNPSESNLYAFSFKGVPPPIIRRIYQDSHNRTMTDGTFSVFRNEISQMLSVPIYEALTPSSIIRYTVKTGLVNSINQLVTLVESMNPRISNINDIVEVNMDGIRLARYPQNNLPNITYIYS